MKNLAEEIFKIIKTYCYDDSRGRTEAHITYSEYDIKKYTFRIRCTTLNQTDHFSLRYNYRLEDFKKEIKQILKNEGFTKIKFDFKNIKRKDSWGNIYTEKKFIAIYFDK